MAWPSSVTAPLTFAKPLPHPLTKSVATERTARRIRSFDMGSKRAWDRFVAVAGAARAIEDVVDIIGYEPNGAIGAAKLDAAGVLAAEALCVIPSAGDYCR